MLGIEIWFKTKNNCKMENAIQIVEQGWVRMKGQIINRLDTIKYETDTPNNIRKEDMAKERGIYCKRSDSFHFKKTNTITNRCTLTKCKQTPPTQPTYIFFIPSLIIHTQHIIPSLIQDFNIPSLTQASFGFLLELFIS